MEKDYNDLIKVFTQIDNEDDMRELFAEIFTANENKDFTLRWKLLNDLYKQMPQRTIAKNLNISLCKITRGSKMLKKENGIIKKILSTRYDDHITL